MAYISNVTAWQRKGIAPKEVAYSCSTCVRDGTSIEQYPDKTAFNLVSEREWKGILEQIEGQLDAHGYHVHVFQMEKEREDEKSDAVQMNEMLQQLSKFDKIMKKHDEQIKRLEDQNHELKVKYEKLDSDYRSVQHENRQLREQIRRQGRRVSERVIGVEKGQKRLDELNRRTMGELERQTRRSKISPGETSIINLENGIVWRIEEIDTVLGGKNDEWGPCFYVSDYKFQLNIATNVVKEYLSFYVALVKGLHDDELEWPFEGEFTFILNNKENDKDVYKKEFVNTTQQANDNFIKPVEMKNVPIGFPRFISVESLKQDKYSRDGSIRLTVLVNPKSKKDN